MTIWDWTATYQLTRAASMPPTVCRIVDLHYDREQPGEAVPDATGDPRDLTPEPEPRGRQFWDGFNEGIDLS